VRAHLGPEVALRARGDFGPALDSLKGRIAVDKARAPVWVSDRIAAAERAETVWRADPCILPKATKTGAEIAGTRAAHLRDGAVMAEFLCWLERTAPEGGLTEIDVVRRLESIRVGTGELRDISFDTICGAGPNGAIVHYRVNEATSRAVVPGELLLVDSGGQYLDGTTDITRTVAIGQVPADARRPFTLVLKGLIAMSRLRWPPGLAGHHLDAVARAGLWQAGLDYDHGTGHGVGVYLGVHEGPAGLSRRSVEPILAGMILSIEPGCYRERAFGIRTENLAVVRPAAVPEGGEREMLGFETLTLAPIDRRLIDPALLDPVERAWLDAYHAQVVAALTPLVEPDTARWLAVVCRPLVEGA
jgi:Xaa-Pro aminopeptidase